MIQPSDKEKIKFLQTVCRRAGKQIKLLQERDKSNEKLIKTLQPKWYENQYLWLGIGFILGKI